MTAEIRAILGPARSGKTHRAVARYREALADGPIGGALWLAPNWRAAASIRVRLLDDSLAGCFAPGVVTFGQFAEALVRGGDEPVRPISGWLKRQLVRQLIVALDQAGRLEYFAPVARAGGLTDLVCEFIREWKRLEIWPEDFQRTCQTLGLSQKDRELLAIYESYQQHLTAHHLYDAEGRFWSARTLLAQGQCRGLDGLSLVVADGFADFTRTQHEILDLLAQRTEALWITLPWEGEGRRPDLFYKPEKTLAELRRRQPSLVEEVLDGPGAGTWPAMAHLGRQLFRNPRQIEPAPTTAGIEIMEAASQLGEIELVGRRIKSLLIGDREAGVSQPVRPQDIAVVIRSVGELEPLFREVFGRLGVPLAIEGGRRLEASGALRLLVTAMRVVLDDWPIRQLLALIGSSYFRPEGICWTASAKGLVQRALRALRETRGRDAMAGELARRSQREGNRGRHWHQAQRLVEQLGRVLDELPESATPGQWVEAWIRLAQRLGLRAALGGAGIEPDEGSGGLGPGCDSPSLAREAAEFDRAAWDQFCGAIVSGDRLSRWMNQSPPMLDRQEATAALVDTLRSVRVRAEAEHSGRVQVVSAANLRGVEVPHLFVAALTETSFPRPERQDTLYSDAESQRFIEAGLPLVARQERNREEMLLFYEVITRATRRLVLSYPALDEKGQPLVPSPHVQELEAACGAGNIERTRAAELNPIPPDGPLYSLQDFRVKAVDAAISGDRALLTGVVRALPELGANVLAGLRVTEQRRQREGFGPWEGIVGGEVARRRIAESFGPRQTIAATSLENYAGCPFRFFLEKVCGVAPLEEFALETDFLARGSQTHEALVLLHRQLNADRGERASPAEIPPEEYETRIDAALDAVFEAEPTSRVEGALAKIDRRIIRRWLIDYRAQHAAYDALWNSMEAPLRPLLFEASFGRVEKSATPDSGNELQASEPLEFVSGNRTVRVSGRVDRVDLGTVAGQEVYNVIDYKTGGAKKLSSESILSGRVLQPAVYAIAVAELLLTDRDTVPWRAGYWQIRDRGFHRGGALELYQEEGGEVVPDAAWSEIRRRLAGTVVELVNSMCEGAFPVYNADERCTSYCPYRTVCRVNQVRALEKAWSPVDPS